MDDAPDIGWLPTATRALIALLIAAVAIQSVRTAWAAVAPFDGAIADGPFQLSNALRRIDAGELPGRDFPAFHGLGLPLAHYPFYRLLGGDLIASELSRQLVSRLGGVAVYLATSWLLCRSLWPGVILAGISVEPFQPILTFNLAMTEPGNSLLSLRGLVPLLFLGLCYRAPGGRFREMILGGVLGIAWLMGIEQSLALVAGVGVTAVGSAISLRRLAPIPPAPSLFVVLAWGLAMGVLLTAACGQEKTGDVFRYYFIAIPADQVWYFGVPPNNFFGDGTRMSFGMTVRVAILGPILAIWWLRGIRLAARGGAEQVRAGLVIAVGSGYAGFSLASTFGMTNAGYLATPLRIAMFLFMFEIYRAGVAERMAALVPSRLVVPAASAAMAMAVLVIFLVSARLASAPRSSLALRWAEHEETFPEMIRATHPHPTNIDLWSIYAGIVEARLGVFHPETDYIIHALGDRREAYVARFAVLRPAYVQTLNGSTFTYEEWLQTTAWAFYERLILNYDVVGRMNGSLLWRRANGPWTEPSRDWLDVPVSNEGSSVVLPAGNPTDVIAVVRLEYDVVNPAKIVPFFGEQGRYLVKAEGSRASQAVSLPPRSPSHEFPIPLAGQAVTLRIGVSGLTLGAKIRATRAAVRYLPSTAATQAILARPPSQSGP